MWICLNNAFFSIVASDRDPDVLNVRARRDGDLERIFPGHTVHARAHSDYAFRAFIPRPVVAAVIAQQVDAIGYTNFKNSVEDDALHNAYADVWVVMQAVQKRPPTHRIG